MITISGPLKIWTGDEGSSHFMSVPESATADIRSQAMVLRRGFGSVKVEATVRGFTWRTSVFPSKGGSYFLPVKVDVLRNTGIAAGDEVTVEIELL